MAGLNLFARRNRKAGAAAADTAGQAQPPAEKGNGGDAPAPAAADDAGTEGGALPARPGTAFAAFNDHGRPESSGSHGFSAIGGMFGEDVGGGGMDSHFNIGTAGREPVDAGQFQFSAFGVEHAPPAVDNEGAFETSSLRFDSWHFGSIRKSRCPCVSTRAQATFRLELK